jgi:hypothetical protein
MYIKAQNLKGCVGYPDRMFLGLANPHPLVRGVDPAPDPSFSHKGFEWTEIMLAK